MSEDDQDFYACLERFGLFEFLGARIGFPWYHYMVQSKLAIRKFRMTEFSLLQNDAGD